MWLYNPLNPDYLLLWIQSRLRGLCGLFKPEIIWIEATFNPHFITRENLFKTEFLCSTTTKYVNLFASNYFEVKMGLEMSFLSEIFADRAYTNNF